MLSWVKLQQTENFYQVQMSDFQGVPRLWPPCKLCLIPITRQLALIFLAFSLSQNLSWAPSSRCIEWFEFSSNPGQKDFCITDGNWNEASAKVLTQNTDRLIWKYAKLDLHLCARVSFLFVKWYFDFSCAAYCERKKSWEGNMDRNALIL